MITHIKGRLSEKSPTNVVIETNGIGYWINISLTTFSQIPDQENIKLFTHLQIKEDSHSLYGFYTLKEREIFRLLISVSGVGTSTARTMLSSLTPEQVIDAISSNNVSVVQSVKGIGSKQAHEPAENALRPDSCESCSKHYNALLLRFKEHIQLVAREA